MVHGEVPDAIPTAPKKVKSMCISETIGSVNFRKYIFPLCLSSASFTSAKVHCRYIQNHMKSNRTVHYEMGSCEPIGNIKS
jgi:hypothetical protein